MLELILYLKKFHNLQWSRTMTAEQSNTDGFYIQSVKPLFCNPFCYEIVLENDPLDPYLLPGGQGWKQ